MEATVHVGELRDAVERAAQDNELWVQDMEGTAHVDELRDDVEAAVQPYPRRAPSQAPRKPTPAVNHNPSDSCLMIDKVPHFNC